MTEKPIQESQEDTALKTKDEVGYPSMYKVSLLNDDYTPMEFVVKVLQEIFNKSKEEAVKIMLEVHKKGLGVCGVFTFDIAETKASMVVDAARRAEYPLQCEIEKV